MHCSRTVYIPKAELLADAELVQTTAASLRPLTLMNTSEKLIALSVNAVLAEAAERTVAGPQCGFVAGRRLEDNVIGLDGALTAYSIDSSARPAAILLDCANAFPSFSHAWVFAILRRTHVPTTLINIIFALSDGLTTYLDFAGTTVATLPLLSPFWYDFCTRTRPLCALVLVAAHFPPHVYILLR